MEKTRLIMIKKEVLVALIVLFCISNIAAFAVGSFYWSGNSMKLSLGESRNFSIILHAGNSDIKIKADITSGSEVLKITDLSKIYTIPLGEKRSVNLEASVPKDAKPGQIYSVRIDFSEIKDSASGEFGFGTAIGQSFNVVVLPETTGWNKTVVLYLAAGITVLLIIIFTLRKVMKGKSHKKRRR